MTRLALADTPRRIQLSRAKDWRMPENTVNVARGPGRIWGNPFRIGDFGIQDAMAAVERFQEWLDGRVTGPRPPSYSEIKVALRGKNLACWCKPDQPCHADVLLQFANKGADHG